MRYKSGTRGIQGHPDLGEIHSNHLRGTNISYQNLPVYSHSEAQRIDHYMKKHKINGEYYYYGNPYVSNSNALKAYHKIFNDLLNNKNGAILFHCNLGRDRTGVTSALILSALGVNKNIIYHDYLLTDHYHYKYHNMKSTPYPKQAGELKHFFNTINDKYGNIHYYLHKAVGLSNDDIHQLRSMYLQPIHKHQKMIQFNQPNKHKKDHLKKSRTNEFKYINIF